MFNNTFIPYANQYAPKTHRPNKISGFVDSEANNIYYADNVAEDEKVEGLQGYLKAERNALYHSKILTEINRKYMFGICGKFELIFSVPIVLCKEVYASKKYRKTNAMLTREIDDIKCANCTSSYNKIKELLDNPYFQDNICGQYDTTGERPVIRIYYNAFSCKNEEEYKAAIANVLAHEAFHYIHHRFMESGFFTDNKHRDDVIEGMADFFAMLYSIEKGYMLNGCFDEESENNNIITDKDSLNFAMAGYELWNERFGSDWPYANALYFYKVENSTLAFSQKLYDYFYRQQIKKFSDVLIYTYRNAQKPKVFNNAFSRLKK